MWRRSTTTGLIVEASHMLQETVGVLSDPERGVDMHASRTDTRRVTSWRTRAERSRSEFVIATFRFVDKNKYAMISGGQGCR